MNKDRSVQRCEGCRWYKQRGNDRGECHRHAPAVSQVFEWQWPLVRSSDTCGEWTDQEAERRKLVRQFALAIVSATGDTDHPTDVWEKARKFAESEHER